MTATHAQKALHAALWGDPDPLLDAIDEGAWLPALFGADEDLAEVVLEVVLAGEVPTPEAVVLVLEEHGATRLEAVARVALVDAFFDAGCRLDGLTYWLAMVHEDAERDRLARQLVTLADRLHSPDGPARVRAILEGVAA